MTLPSFIDSPRFPNLLGWEYTVEPLYEVDIVPRGRGHEQRNLSALYPRRRITVRIPQDKIADIVQINKWHHAVRGKFIGFRVQDPTDYLSIDLQPYDSIGTDQLSQTAATDQPLAESTTSPGLYRLIKRYRLAGDFANLDQELPILKPVVATIKVANTLGDEQPAESWEIDEETGLLEPHTAFTGTPGFWGGQFDLPMRFESGLPIDVRNMMIDEASFALIEVPRA